MVGLNQISQYSIENPAGDCLVVGILANDSKSRFKLFRLGR
jgi:hypothetical protein